MIDPATIRLRSATAADMGFLRALHEAAMRPHLERVRGAWDAEKQRRGFLEKTDPTTHLVVEEAGEPVGCQWVRRHPDALELVRLYLMPEAQGRGLGTWLLGRLLAAARGAGLPVRLRVLRGNPARRLYARLGFVVTNKTDTHVFMEHDGGMESRIVLRDVVDDDVPLFFEHQLDPDARRMAAFTSEDPTDRAAYDEHWRRIRAAESVTIRTVLNDGEVAGHVASFGGPAEREVTYWIARPFWGRGVATGALARFLAEEATRPLYARVAKDNPGSIRVLEKCGFVVVREERGFAHARGAEIDELVLELGG